MPPTTASEASRIGTAPLRPHHITNSRSPRDSCDGSSSGVTTSGRITNPSSDGKHEPAPPEPSREDEAEVDRQPERDEDGELPEVGERRMEVPNLDPAREVGVADQDPGDEDGEEARAVGDGGDAVDDAGRQQHRGRVERAVGKR